MDGHAAVEPTKKDGDKTVALSKSGLSFHELGFDVRGTVAWDESLALALEHLSFLSDKRSRSFLLRDVSLLC